jgi:hypothetical protein
MELNFDQQKYFGSFIYTTLTNKFDILSCYDQHGTMIFYDKIVSLSKSFVMTNHGAEFFCTNFNKTTFEALHIIAIYKSLKISIQHLNSTLNRIFKNVNKLSNYNNWKLQSKHVNTNI